jgi:hypothetical protein
MTSISALSSQHSSPLQRLQNELQAEVSSGAINSTDQSALSSALGDIDSTLQSSKASDQTGANRPKINDLIQQEVSAGKLTSQQATELQGIFKAAFSHGHHHGAGGPPPSDGSSSVDGTDGSTSGNSLVDLLQQLAQSLNSSLTDPTSSSATGSSDTTNAIGPSPASSPGGNSATDVLQQFLQSLKSALADSTYSATGSSDTANASDPSLSGVFVNDRI